MKTLDYKPHALFPGEMYWYVKQDGITVSIWATYGSALEALICPSIQELIMLSFTNN